MAKTRAILLLLALSVIMKFGETAAVTINVADLQRQFWREKLPDVGMPQRLAARLSPLSLTQLQYFAPVLKRKDAASLDAEQFCSSANLLCRQDVAYIDAVGSRFSSNRETVADKKMHIFLDKDELRQSGHITLPDLHSPITWKSFLPRELAEIMPPFSSASLSNILALLNIPRESNMSRNMMSSLELCEARADEGEVKKCSTSVEDMVEFVLSVSGPEVELLTDPSILGSAQTVTVSKASRRENGKGSKPPVACHSFVYPYGVYYCHAFRGSDIFNVELEVVQNEKRVTRSATVVCHYFSSAEPGKDVACHTVFGDMLLWVPKTRQN